MTIPGKFLLAPVVLAALAVSGKTHEKIDVGSLEIWMIKVRPEVEKALGHALPRLPQVEMAGRNTDPESGDIEAHVRLRFPHLHKQDFYRAMQDALDVCRQAVVARHVEGTGTLVVFTDHHVHMPRWHEALKAAAPVDPGTPGSGPGQGGVPLPRSARISDSADPKPKWHDALRGTATAEFVKLAVVHELVRYALDAKYNLGRLREACQDADEWFSLQAVIEGRAQWLTRQLARQWGLEEVFPLLAMRYLYVPDVSPDPGLRAVSQSVVRQKHWACSQGLAFWTYLLDQGRLDEKTVFARLPRQVKALQQPDQYLRALQTNRPDLAGALGVLQTLLPSSEWTALAQPWTPEMFVQVAGLLNEKTRAEKVARGWEEGRSLIWSRKDNPGCQVALSVVRYDSVAGARSYFGFALDLQRKRDELSNNPCGLPLKVVQSRTHPITLSGVDEAIYFEKEMQLTNSSRTLPAHIVLVRQGDRVVELTWYGMTADTAWAQRVLETLPR